jgi:membrane peptidoglycan carboxypeptidase
MYKSTTDGKQGLFNTTQQVTFVLFVTSFYSLLLWKGNDHNEDMGRIVTAKNHVDKNVRTFVASLLPLCLVMLV